MSKVSPFASPVHFLNSSKSSGPLYNSNATKALPFRAPTSLEAKFVAICQPSSPKLALPSRTTTISTVELQCKISRPSLSNDWQENSLQSLKAKRSSLSASQHFPSPCDSWTTVLMRLCEPP